MDEKKIETSLGRATPGSPLGEVESLIIDQHISAVHRAMQLLGEEQGMKVVANVTIHTIARMLLRLGAEDAGALFHGIAELQFDQAKDDHGQAVDPDAEFRRATDAGLTTYLQGPAERQAVAWLASYLGVGSPASAGVHIGRILGQGAAAVAMTAGDDPEWILASFAVAFAERVKALREQARAESKVMA